MIRQRQTFVPLLIEDTTQRLTKSFIDRVFSIFEVYTCPPNYVPMNYTSHKGAGALPTLKLVKNDACFCSQISLLGWNLENMALDNFAEEKNERTACCMISA